MPRRVFRTVWSVGLLLSLVASPTLLLAQRGRQGGPPLPGAPGSPTGPPTGLVFGRVIDGDTGSPVGGAIVQIGAAMPPAAAIEAGLAVPTRGGAQRYVIADAQGRFVLRDVPHGDHPLSARLPGYLPAQYGQRRAMGPGDQLTVDATRPVTEATIRMWKYAAINGIVTDEAGEPAVGVNVRGLSVRMTGGRRRLAPVSSATTDDRGVYRLTNLGPGEYYVFVPSTTSSVATSTVDWYTEARTNAGSSAEVLQSFRESRAPTPMTTGLRVGDHVVSVSALRNSTSPSVTTDGRIEIYRTIYHPSATTLDQATAITLTSGEEREGVDLQLILEPALTVSGTVHGPDGPAVHLGVRLLPADAQDFATELGTETATTATAQDGTFTLLGVPPGQYTLEVLRMPRPTTSSAVTTIMATGPGAIVMSSLSGPGDMPDVPDAPTLWAEQAISVGSQDIDGVELHLREGARVHGRIEFQGAAAPPDAEALQRISITLTPASGQRLSALTSPMRASADGTFRTLGYPPGRYFLGATAPATPGARWFLKSAMAGGRDLVDQPAILDEDDITGVVITFTDQAPELTGTVQLPPDADGEALVAIFPNDHRTWIANGMSPRLARTVRTGRQGQFTLSALRPGTYLALAVPAGTELDLQDPAEVANLARLGTMVAVPETGSASVQLAIVQVRREPQP